MSRLVQSCLILVLASIVAAQIGPQALLLPACIAGLSPSGMFMTLTLAKKACDPAAIASVNCTNADQYCHCVRQDGVLANITPCADVQCAKPSMSMYTFTTLFGEVCAQYNISVPVVGSNSSIMGTNVTFTAPSPSITPYTGRSARLSAVNGYTSIAVTAGLALWFFLAFAW